MNFDELVQSVVNDTVGPGGSLSAFRSELALCGTILAILLLKIVVPRWKIECVLRDGARAAGGDGLLRIACGRDVALALVFHGCGGDSARQSHFFRHADGRQLHGGLASPVAAVRASVHHLHANRRGLRRRGYDRVLRPHARRLGGHVPDDLGQSHSDRDARRRDGQRPLLRVGRHETQPAQEPAKPP